MTLPDATAVADLRERSPWSSRRLWSLWELMLEKYGLLFAKATLELMDAKWLCASRSIPGLPPEAPRIDRGTIDRVTNLAIQSLRQASILTDLDSILPEIDRLEKSIALPPVSDIPTLAQSLRHLIARVQDELGAQYFFHLDQRDVPFYVTDHPFGEMVSEKFDWATEDISEAGKCMALQRPTACVFHLMRVLEHAVQRLGKKLKVEIDVSTQSWHQICLHINKQIESMPIKTPTQRQKKTDYAAAAAHLTSVRIAWRNEVMHPKQTYTRDEAFNVFNATKVFMASLVELPL